VPINPGQRRPILRPGRGNGSADSRLKRLGIVAVVFLLPVVYLSQMDRLSGRAVAAPGATVTEIQHQPCTVGSQSGVCTGAFLTTPIPTPTPTPSPTATPTATPTPTPTPQTNGCLASPHLCGFPDATNTGVPSGTVLTPSGSITVTTAGTTIDALDVSGSISVQANNVTIKRTRVRSSATWPINVVDGVTGVLIQDVEVDGLNGPDGAAVGWTGFTCRRCNLHGSVDGVRIGAGPGSTVDIEDSYIHDLSTNSLSAGHQQDVSTFGTSSGLVHHSTLLWPNKATACVMIKSDQGSISNVTIDGNLMDGGGYTFYALDGGVGHGAPTGIRLTNNRFGRDYIYGLADYLTAVTVTGNVWDDTRVPVTP
jgi:hypothetical protein